MNPSQLTKLLKQEAARVGFNITGACPAVTPAGFHQFVDWLEQGFAGEMTYLEDRKEAYQHPSHVLPDATSILMLGLNYQTASPTHSPPGTGRIARYAWSNVDYHDLVHKKLKQLKKFVKELDPSIGVRGVVDTAPLLEREFAELAGIGWRAKNTLLINKTAGSWFFLAALLLDVPLEYDEPMNTSHCGTCTACIDACPTDAFVAPHVLDATKCISYLTIEHRTALPHSLRSKMQDWILGCDICQEVCPWNRKAPLSHEADFEPIEGHNPIELRSLFKITDEQFRERFRKTPLWRPKRRGILRNAAIALGNKPHHENLAALALGISDCEPLVRGASAWALGAHRYDEAKEILIKSQEQEPLNEIQQEITEAISRLSLDQQ